ncbi:alpha-N-arabinofuranosidase A [Aspergillus candidus]|uniref:non-reducing end alpha-L-arabinofuranosidase n=1 Tax=Aspergillus candidus TaxID=41067 RepID=A0A2I2F3L8_ASPCN|nr:alpha-N-arabinofuranosidase A [Aspergillus candidus]PLB35240.1 alpha-N-arabinofuranosidase A [Aspergillus candidus]
MSGVPAWSHRVTLNERANLHARDTPQPLAELTVWDHGGNESSPLLYGIMFEEMDQSGDGGIHGQLLRNNGFQGDEPGLLAYAPIGDVDIDQDSDNPVSEAITSSLRLSVPEGETAFVGFANQGYNGVPVMNETYTSEFWMKGDYEGEITLQLIGSTSGEVYANHNLTVHSIVDKFTPWETTFNSTASPDGDNEWRLLVDGNKVAGSSLNFGLVQLFPPTFHSRKNGLRDDVAKVVEDLRPSFLRFPGGNNIEGLDVNSRWKWNETIGPVVDRPGRQSPWNVPNTDALGLDEYMYWCDDMGMEPFLILWNGKSYNEILTGSDLDPYIEDALNELEYLTGPPDSIYGKLRVQNGREEPWKLTYVGIGNEDDYTGGCETHPERFTQFYNVLREKYPDLVLIASTMKPECLPEELPKPLTLDQHYYRKPDELVAMFNYWDNQPRDQPVIVGEFGARNFTDPDGVFWTFMQMACSEAVHMIGIERNSDIIKMAAYAPLLQHYGFTQWSPTMFGLDSSPGSLTLSTSYYVQQMFSTNRGSTILPVNTTNPFGPLYWGASKNDESYIVKLANYGDEEQTITITVPETMSGTLHKLEGPKETANLPHDVQILPQKQEVDNPDGIYEVKMAAWGVAVLVVS